MKRDPDTEQPERIAFATSEPPSPVTAARWTELAVYYLHRPEKPGRRWRAVSRGCSTYPGEHTKEEAITVGTLDRALKLFDAFTQLGRSVIAQAGDWEAENIVYGSQSVVRTRPSTSRGVSATVEDQGYARPMMMGTVPVDLDPPPPPGATQEEALRWLYGDELDQAKPATLIARDFGVGESSVRMAIAQERDIKLPLRTVARFLDRARFRFERAREKGGSANG